MVKMEKYVRKSRRRFAKKQKNWCRKEGKTGSKIGGPAKADPSRS